MQKCTGPGLPGGLTERYLRTIQWSILDQYNPCRYYKQFHMTLQRKGYYNLPEEVFGLQIKNMSTVSSDLSLFKYHFKFHCVSYLVEMFKL